MSPTAKKNGGEIRAKDILDRREGLSARRGEKPWKEAM